MNTVAMKMTRIFNIICSRKVTGWVERGKHRRMCVCIGVCVKNNIENEVAAIPLESLQSVFHNFVRRLAACIASDGNHIENL